MAQTDREALVALYNSTDGPNWSNSTGWDTPADLADWHGVSANDEGRVVGLTLFGNGLKGPIPPELGRLAALKELYLFNNQLSGPIPPELGGLSKLETLWLTNNKLTGPIPPELGNLAALQYLDLEDNKLSGPIPKELGALSALRELRLNNNQLSGHIPPQLGQLGALQHLDLSRNKLDGPIPRELGNLAALQSLTLNGNKLSGPIPEELGKLTGLEELFLSRNNLSGSIPKELGALRALRDLRLYSNQLSGNPGSLEGARLTRWLEQLRGSRPNRPWAMSVVEFLVALWHFLIPIFDDVTDVILLVATFKDRGALWWACVGAFVVADVERVVLLLVALCLLLCWIPFALVDKDSREGLFHVPLKVLNGWHHLQLEENEYDTTPSRSALRWPILDAVTWAVVGSRSKSSSLMRLCGLQGDTPIDVLERSGFGLSLIDTLVKYHPYSCIGGAIFSCPHGHRLPGGGTATRRSGVMLRAVGETLVVDSLFLALSLSSEPWEEGVSIGVYSFIFSVLELLTELQYYAAEAGADMTMSGEQATVTSIEEPIRRAPAV